MNADEHSATIVVMTAGGTNPQVMINVLKKHWPDLQVIEERPESKKKILVRRAKRLGWPIAVGQLATMVASRLGKKIAIRRTEEILGAYGLSAEIDYSLPIHHVDSVNDTECHALLAQIKPKVILTISCRLLSKQTLAACPCPVINFHAGINPAYRGQMGGYWSLVENDADNFGATVHLVDAGTDTGGTIYEQRLRPQKGDFIATYPLLLTAASTERVIKAVKDILNDELVVHQQVGTTALRFPPPIWTWVRNGLGKGIW
ncbi:formyl transferase [Rhizobiales bacterium RZME27]|uniref:Formyl transferase n=1 Tax=Endobacterium cereale TaxID=2663029 RepID=A0A6A8A7M8_9HYPH|nr:formyl transferase [Endobacterium cereale]MEB2843334.1 formyl transferase [Endobacterium cereale]MQY47292.1 formyl transferase [Endobacterium cereale]